ncbi:hypothetical protein CONLIGDRAFT_626972 [Coniochaeta ligniaria NRRL 30616]|uniref:Uncharacterized protein n=1 Tax=Coniochaeta ligniaria NRRL 30616 TaxID=1408157 RepID=A0A1J7JXT3_9PEZI|nr:hypothetical protein CONLIGDRAFT_626972 [Coniochaeta ligniaria NRRL 30616]
MYNDQLLWADDPSLLGHVWHRALYGLLGTFVLLFADVFILPEQTDGIDCGILCCAVALFLATGSPVSADTQMDP